MWQKLQSLVVSHVKSLSWYIQCPPFLSHLSITWELGMLTFLQWQGGEGFSIAWRFQPSPSPKMHLLTLLRERSLTEQATNGQPVNCLKDYRSNNRQIDPLAWCSRLPRISLNQNTGFTRLPCRRPHCHRVSSRLKIEHECGEMLGSCWGLNTWPKFLMVWLTFN